MTDGLTLSAKEKAILESYKLTLDGLAKYLGSGYELVLHSLESYDHSVIKIVNGFHTGRKEGAPITDLALSLLQEIKQKPGKPRAIDYFTKNRKGEPLKSTTIPLIGDRGRIIGLLCINYYLNTPLSDVLSNLNPPADSLHPTRTETFAEDPSDLMDQVIAESLADIERNPSITPHQRNKALVKSLYQAGVFDMKKSVELASQKLGISPNTVYMHLRNFKKS